jgi:hypothetical protein
MVRSGTTQGCVRPMVDSCNITHVVLTIVAMLIMMFTSTTLSLYPKGERLDPQTTFVRIIVQSSMFMVFLTFQNIIELS